MAITRDDCEELDRRDPIGWVRERFTVPHGVVYLDGNSLGALPGRMAQVLAKEWGRGLVSSWDGAGWMDAPRRIGDKIARLIGVAPGEVLAADSTTITLTKLLLAALSARPDRSLLLTTATNFPSDLYAGEAAARLAGGSFRMVEPPALLDELSGAAGVAALYLTHVDYRTGEMFDMEGLTAAAHESGALAVWDLCHSAGAVALDCGGAGVDLALGCGYKYLNGGPGAPSFLYVRSELQGSLPNALPGWLGHEAPFGFEGGFRQAPGIGGYLTSSPPVLGLTGLEAGVDTFAGVEMADVRAKSVRLGQLFLEVVLEEAGGLVGVASPGDPARRGSQISLRHDRAKALVSELAAAGVVGDFRPPDVCRFGFAPLYLTYREVFDAARKVATAVVGASR